MGLGVVFMITFVIKVALRIEGLAPQTLYIMPKDSPCHGFGYYGITMFCTDLDRYLFGSFDGFRKLSG